MKLFDLHCDTAYRMFRENIHIDSPKLHINLNTLSCFHHVTQTFAFWSNNRDSNAEAWEHFLASYKQFMTVKWPENVSVMLSIEDLRLIDGKIERLALLEQMGIRFVGLFWGGDNIFGTSHNSTADTGLSMFGKETLKECFRLGLIPDVSHASHRSTEQILDLATAQSKPVIASHSNFYECFPHSRNLLTAHAIQIQKLGGLVGLSFVPEHLGGNAIECFANHYVFGYDLGLSDILCIGSDFDGTDNLIFGISCQSDIGKIAQFLLDQGFSHPAIQHLFYQNGEAFLRNIRHHFVSE